MTSIGKSPNDARRWKKRNPPEGAIKTCKLSPVNIGGTHLTTAIPEANSPFDPCMRENKNHTICTIATVVILGVGSVWGGGLDVDIAHHILSPNLVWDVKLLSDPVRKIDRASLATYIE